MQASYDQAMAEVFSDEGGYTDDPNDPGGPTNYGITIHDARLYWKSNATADDVKNMPRSVAEAIYATHYAAPLHYNDLPPGLDSGHPDSEPGLLFVERVRWRVSAHTVFLRVRLLAALLGVSETNSANRRGAPRDQKARSSHLPPIGSSSTESAH